MVQDYNYNLQRIPDIAKFNPLDVYNNITLSVNNTLTSSGNAQDGILDFLTIQNIASNSIIVYWHVGSALLLCL